MAHKYANTTSKNIFLRVWDLEYFYIIIEISANNVVVLKFVYILSLNSLVKVVVAQYIPISKTRLLCGMWWLCNMCAQKNINIIVRNVMVLEYAYIIHMNLLTRNVIHLNCVRINNKKSSVKNVADSAICKHKKWK